MLLGLILTHSPRELSVRVCQWLTGAGLDSQYSCVESFDQWLEPAIIYGALAFLFIYLSGTFIVFVIQYCRFRYRPTSKASDTLSNLSRPWAEHGTWSPTLSVAANGNSSLRGVGEFWFYGKYVEITGVVDFTLPYPSTTSSLHLTGFPFTFGESGQIELELDGECFPAMPNPIRTSIGLKRAFGDRQIAEGCHKLAIKGVYKTS